MSQQNEPPKNRKLVWRVRVFALLLAGLAAVVVTNGLMSRTNASVEEKSWSEEQAISTVTIVHPTPSAGGNALTLPGQVAAYYIAPIYPRVSGYVRTWNKDIGARVHRGEVLAEIDIPDVDQQIAQARADLANAEASRQVSQSTAERWTNLLKIQAVSKQEAEEKSGDLAVKSAQVKSAQANLDRLLTMKTFANIVAPFDGLVTQRAIDIGNLVNAGAGSSSAALFTIADIHKMRVYVHVPQNYSAQIKDHLKATLTVPEYPEQNFPAELVSTSDAISDQTNTLLVQFEADNPDGKLKTGEYAQVTIQLPSGTHTLTIPVSALLFRADGLQVATLGPDNHVVMKPIKISNDLGTQVEISSGLNATDNVIDNPPDSLQSGDVVRVAGANDKSQGK